MANDPIDKLRRTAYPNPERIGCLKPETFEALSRRDIAFNDPVWTHIEHCSPCYCQFADIREALFKQDRRGDLQRAARLALVALILIAAGVSLYIWKRGNAAQSRSTIASNREEAAVLNFEDESELRGTQGNPGIKVNSGVQHLPRNQLSLTIYLPLGSPTGEYELEISQSTGESVWRAQASAVIKDGLTSIPVKGDLRKLPGGEYHFKFRRLGETWREKNVLVK